MLVLNDIDDIFHEIVHDCMVIENIFVRVIVVCLLIRLQRFGIINVDQIATFDIKIDNIPEFWHN